MGFVKFQINPIKSLWQETQNVSLFVGISSFEKKPKEGQCASVYISRLDHTMTMESNYSLTDCDQIVTRVSVAITQRAVLLA